MLLEVVAVVRGVVLSGSDHFLAIHAVHVGTHELGTVVLDTTRRSTCEASWAWVCLPS